MSSEAERPLQPLSFCPHEEFQMAKRVSSAAVAQLKGGKEDTVSAWLQTATKHGEKEVLFVEVGVDVACAEGTNLISHPMMGISIIPDC